MIWWLIALLSLVAAALMAIPLLRKPQADTAMFDTTPSVLLDQLEEVHRDHKRGVISETEAKAAEQEIKRRIRCIHATPRQHRRPTVRAGA